MKWTDSQLRKWIMIGFLVATLAALSLIYGLVVRSFDDPPTFPCLVERPCPER